MPAYSARGRCPHPAARPVNGAEQAVCETPKERARWCSGARAVASAPLIVQGMADLPRPGWLPALRQRCGSARW